MLEDRDAKVRDETKQLTIEIYRWVRDALLPQLSSLKPTILQELKAEFDKIKADKKPTPERLLRSQQALTTSDDATELNGDAESTGANPDSVDGDEAAEIDPFELLDPVDIISKLPNDFYTLIEAKKWQERKDALEKLNQLLEANPKLDTSADYAELVRQLKKIISKDANIIVVTLGIKTLGQLANGLRKNFHNFANSCITVILEKFKEKKANVVQALRETIDAVYISVSYRFLL